MHSSRLVTRPPILAAAAVALALGIAAVATGAPTLSITDGPDVPTRDTTPEFTFTVGDTTGATTVECSIDQGSPDWTPCSESYTSDAPLSDGSYTFRVRVTDESAEPFALATRDFVVDTAAPALSITSGPTGPIKDPAPTFGFSGEPAATFQCSVSLGSADYGPCSGTGTHSPATLPDGSYTFYVRATDQAGNTAVATRTFTLDTVAPTTTITSTPLGTTANQSPSFTFTSSEGGVSFQCRRDDEQLAPCSSPKSYAGLSVGAHQFHVRATDAAGNVGEVKTESFTIDLTNPELTILTGPSGPTPDSTPAFTFEAEAGTTVECSVDQGTPSFGPCSGGATSHAVTSPLADGSYVFRVRADDHVAGHQATIQPRSFTVDTVAPNTAIDSGPSGLVNDANPTFQFSATEGGVTFQCRRNSEAFAPCTSPRDYENLGDGNHTFQVRATDAAGNVDTTPASASFAVDTIAPVVSIDFGPLGTTTDDSPLFGFTTDATTVDCSIDQGTPSYGTCFSPSSHGVTQRLAAGSYTFRVRGTDGAGNATVATRSFTVAGGSSTPPAQQPPSQPPTTASTPRLLSPFPLVRLTGRLTRTGAKVEILTVRAPRGAKVSVRAKPKCAQGTRCPAKQGSGTIGRKGSLRFKRFELGYRAGAVIEVRVSQGTAIGKYTRFVVRRGKAPQRVDQCLMPGATRGSRCPAA